MESITMQNYLDKIYHNVTVGKGAFHFENVVTF